MDDRWEDWRHERDQEDYRRRQQGGWQERSQGSSQGGEYGGQHRQQQNWSGQQGGWNDDHRSSGQRRGGDYGPTHDWGEQRSQQPHQREFRGSDKPWGGSSTGGFGSGSYERGFGGYGGSANRENFGDGSYGGAGFGGSGYGESSGQRSRYEREQGSSGEYRGSMRPQSGSMASGMGGAYGWSGQDEDIGARRETRWGSFDNPRQTGSQSFASDYGMRSGSNYDSSMRQDRMSGGGISGNAGYGRGYGPDYINQERQEDRGFFARAGDEIASWFGDDDAARRREQDYRGHGPSDYTRSDDRIREDVNDRLTDDPRVDARKISVSVDKGEVTLNGTVASRDAKRRAEDCIDRISGVKHVQNNLRIEQTSQHTGSYGSSGGTSHYTGEATGASSGTSGMSHTGTSGSTGTTGSTSGATGSTGSSTGSTGTMGSSSTGTSTTGTSATTGSGSSTGGVSQSERTAPGSSGSGSSTGSSKT